MQIRQFYFFFSTENVELRTKPKNLGQRGHEAPLLRRLHGVGQPQRVLRQFAGVVAVANHPQSGPSLEWGYGGGAFTIPLPETPPNPNVSSGSSPGSSPLPIILNQGRR